MTFWTEIDHDLLSNTWINFLCQLKQLFSMLITAIMTTVQTSDVVFDEFNVVETYNT